MSTLSYAIATEFKRILAERKITVSTAARELRVSRQAFHNYLNGKSMPRQNTLSRAMDKWDFKLMVGMEVFDRSSFPQSAEQTPVQEQLPLVWESLDAIRKEDLKVSVARVGSTFSIDVKIEIPA